MFSLWLTAANKLSQAQNNFPKTQLLYQKEQVTGDKVVRQIQDGFIFPSYCWTKNIIRAHGNYKTQIYSCHELQKSKFGTLKAPQL